MRRSKSRTFSWRGVDRRLLVVLAAMTACTDPTLQCITPPDAPIAFEIIPDSTRHKGCLLGLEPISNSHWFDGRNQDSTSIVDILNMQDDIYIAVYVGMP